MKFFKFLKDIHLCNVSFDQFNALLLNKNIN